MHDSDRAEERYGGKDRGEGQGGKDRNYVITHPVGGRGLKGLPKLALEFGLAWLRARNVTCQVHERVVLCVPSEICSSKV